MIWLEKELITEAFLQDLKQWVLELRDGNAILKDGDIFISFIRQTVNGGSCYDTPQETNILHSISSYELESYLASFLLKPESFKQEGFNQADIINFSDNWSSISEYYDLEDEHINEDDYCNLANIA